MFRRLNLWCPATKARRNSCAYFSINSKDCLCKRCGENTLKGLLQQCLPNLSNDRAWLNISPFEWVSLFSRVHWCSALSDLLAFLIRCINPFAKSGNACCDCVWLCVCVVVGLWRGGIPGAFTSTGSVRWLSNNGHNPFKTAELESSEDKKDKEDK